MSRRDALRLGSPCYTSYTSSRATIFNQNCSPLPSPHHPVMSPPVPFSPPIAENLFMSDVARLQSSGPTKFPTQGPLQHDGSSISDVQTCPQSRFNTHGAIPAPVLRQRRPQVQMPDVSLATHYANGASSAAASSTHTSPRPESVPLCTPNLTPLAGHFADTHCHSSPRVVTRQYPTNSAAQPYTAVAPVKRNDLSSVFSMRNFAPAPQAVSARIVRITTYSAGGVINVREDVGSGLIVETLAGSGPACGHDSVNSQSQDCLIEAVCTPVEQAKDGQVATSREDSKEVKDALVVEPLDVLEKDLLNCASATDSISTDCTETNLDSVVAYPLSAVSLTLSESDSDGDDHNSLSSTYAALLTPWSTVSCSPLSAPQSAMITKSPIRWRPPTVVTSMLTPEPSPPVVASWLGDSKTTGRFDWSIPFEANTDATHVGDCATESNPFCLDMPPSPA